MHKALYYDHLQESKKLSSKAKFLVLQSPIIDKEKYLVDMKNLDDEIKSCIKLNERRMAKIKAIEEAKGKLQSQLEKKIIDYFSID